MGAGRRPTPALCAAFWCAAAISLVAASLLFCGCSTAGPGSGAVLHAELAPGTPEAADLDGDGVTEEILIDPKDRSLAISDGDASYRSRAKWRVVQAVLGDTDHDGLAEVVTLLDSADGRHLGLFAYFGGAYRERLVTQKIVPSPVALEVIDGAQLIGSLSGDVVVLVQAAAGDAAATQRIYLGWNGFGFTRIETSAAP